MNVNTLSLFAMFAAFGCVAVNLHNALILKTAPDLSPEAIASRKFKQSMAVFGLFLSVTLAVAGVYVAFRAEKLTLIEPAVVLVLAAVTYESASTTNEKVLHLLRSMRDHQT